MYNFAKRSLVAAALLASTSAFAATPDWRVSEVSGTVTVERSGKKIAVKQNTTLKAGDVIITGAKGRAVLVRGKEFVVISPQAKLQVADPKKAGAVTQWFQYIGNALFKVEKKTTPHFGVKTPYLAAVVKGTTFNVSVSAQNTSVQVTEGMVEVATDDNLEAALITPGLIAMVSAANANDLVVVVGDGSRDYSGAAVRGAPDFVTKVPQGGASESAFSAAPGLTSDREEKSDRSSSAGDERGRGSSDNLVANLDDGVSGARGVGNGDDAGERSGNGRGGWSDDDLNDDRDQDRGDEDNGNVDAGRGGDQDDSRGDGDDDDRDGRDGRGREDGPDDRGNGGTGFNASGDEDLDLGGSNADRGKDGNVDGNRGSGGNDELDGSGVNVGIDAGKSGDTGQVDLGFNRGDIDLDFSRGLDAERGRGQGGRDRDDDDDDGASGDDDDDDGDDDDDDDGPDERGNGGGDGRGNGNGKP